MKLQEPPATASLMGQSEWKPLAVTGFELPLHSEAAATRGTATTKRSICATRRLGAFPRRMLVILERHA